MEEGNELSNPEDKPDSRLELPSNEDPLSDKPKPPSRPKDDRDGSLAKAPGALSKGAAGEGALLSKKPKPNEFSCSELLGKPKGLRLRLKDASCPSRLLPEVGPLLGWRRSEPRLLEKR